MQIFIDSKKNNIEKRESFYFLSFLFLIIFAGTFFLLTVSSNVIFTTKNISNKNKVAFALDVFNFTQTQSSVDEEVIPVNVVLYKNAFEDIDIQAKAALVLDIATGKVLYEKNKNDRMPLASLTKTMTAIIASELLDKNTIITIEKSDLTKEGDLGLFAEEKWKLADLLDFTLMTSSNDGVSAIVSQAGNLLLHNSAMISTKTQNPKEIFVEKMNEKARELGLEQTEFYNESGLDLNTKQSGAYGTAKETTRLFEYILNTNPHLLEATTNKISYFFSQNDLEHTAKNTNEFVELFSGIIGSKTGFTDLAGGNLGVVFDSGIGSPIIIVVLGSTIEGRFEDVLKLYKASLLEVSQNVL
ncbi:hypothetical protein KJ973_03210 [Patescibacteria group bacterium]|nr:hypothetical protein [Patescibacteria group bacterium]MBU1246643.1 hypothetical protein [Patescibacteria group bacterium]MBU1519673.1 hypothetical protein [Patescibacteria group bacterium]MBU1730544.1 hypothetical protein [Patescibacteria group bacterium]MBU1956133.1 hypothetical protein [Patescibacteria group bacterium]